MTKVNFWLKRLIKEWLFLGSTVGVVVTSIYLRRFPTYQVSDFRILFLIFSFLVALKGVEKANILRFIAHKIANSNFVALKLVVLVGFMSVFLTNDISLLVVVPITLAMNIKHKDLLVILEAISANAFSSLLPFGNPQNMFIYWFYDLSLFEFVKVIYPFVLVSVSVLLMISFFLKVNVDRPVELSVDVDKKYPIYLCLVAVMLLVVVKAVPIYFSFLVLVYAAFFERQLLKVDYFLLGIFFMFFGFTDNLQRIIHIHSIDSGSVFVLSAILSQIMSNVPAALFLADFTKDWHQLLWGVSVGGYGNFIGSLANLIAYRVYVMRYPSHRYFLLKFLLIGYFFYFLTFIYHLAFPIG